MPHDHGAGNGRLTRLFGPARPPRVLHASGRWRRRETGLSLIGAAGRSRFPAPPMAGLVEWGGRASTPPLYKEGEGGHHPTFLLHPSFFTFASSLHLPWREEVLGLRRWRLGSLLSSAALLPTSPRWRRQPREEGADTRLSYLGQLRSWPSRRQSPTITGWGTVASLVHSILLARHVSPMQVAGGGGGKPSRRRLG